MSYYKTYDGGFSSGGFSSGGFSSGGFSSGGSGLMGGSSGIQGGFASGGKMKKTMRPKLIGLAQRRGAGIIGGADPVPEEKQPYVRKKIQKHLIPIVDNEYIVSEAQRFRPRTTSAISAEKKRLVERIVERLNSADPPLSKAEFKRKKLEMIRETFPVIENRATEADKKFREKLAIKSREIAQEIREDKEYQRAEEADEEGVEEFYPADQFIAPPAPNLPGTDIRYNPEVSARRQDLQDIRDAGLRKYENVKTPEYYKRQKVEFTEKDLQKITEKAAKKALARGLSRAGAKKEAEKAVDIAIEQNAIIEEAAAKAPRIRVKPTTSAFPLEEYVASKVKVNKATTKALNVLRKKKDMVAKKIMKLQEELDALIEEEMKITNGQINYAADVTFINGRPKKAIKKPRSAKQILNAKILGLSSKLRKKHPDWSKEEAYAKAKEELSSGEADFF
jgi:hypothetical protein